MLSALSLQQDMRAFLVFVFLVRRSETCVLYSKHNSWLHCALYWVEATVSVGLCTAACSLIDFSLNDCWVFVQNGELKNKLCVWTGNSDRRVESNCFYFVWTEETNMEIKSDLKQHSQHIHMSVFTPTCSSLLRFAVFVYLFTFQPYSLYVSTRAATNYCFVID